MHNTKGPISICIPRVQTNIRPSDIKQTFETVLGYSGCVDKVDLIIKGDDQGRSYNRVFVHFRVWPDTFNADIAMERMMSDGGTGTFQLVYDDPWYWKCSMSRTNPRANKVAINRRSDGYRPTVDQ